MTFQKVILFACAAALCAILLPLRTLADGANEFEDVAPAEPEASSTQAGNNPQEEIEDASQFDQRPFVLMHQIFSGPSDDKPNLVGVGLAANVTIILQNVGDADVSDVKASFPNWPSRSLKINRKLFYRKRSVLLENLVAK